MQSTAAATIPQLLSPDDPRLPAVLDLIRTAFAGMAGRIDPPSSMLHLTLSDLRRIDREVWAIGAPPAACMVLTPQVGTLYLGKLAVSATARGRGLARVMVDTAAARARRLGFATLTLQTRVELVENQATFQHLGFREAGRTAHPGYDRSTSITYVMDTAP
ncbi:GNAT family N-acetyltransferase [Loktanella sp. M215]|nr:GNAT family N-acetyltransferase [Loktanella sp. M215]